ncbi:SH3 domain-containing protein [Erythrobacter sp. BLCC-B19]|uniref:SH3 domain-containing protein n=1 Tax=Erythrobacter sp. BLCC-B19 TaxID=3025315 RepID=UPI0023626D32|nr:SH3 domain-containing protein [Erythrobacter sp. BLCC-B19]WDA40763.1 SH3 domain-containing protein [Erythrobacter sp. BLCC-B19]
MQGFRFITAVGLALTLAVTALLAPLAAQDRVLPYWAMLRYDKVNMRTGPSNEYPVAWVYLRKGLPMKVVRIREGWRLVEDHEGTQGWMSASQLDPARAGLVIGEGLAEVRGAPDATSVIKWRAQPGVVARIKPCKAGWCEVDIAGRKGFMSAARLWGSEVLPGDE